MPCREIRGHQVYVPDELESVVNNLTLMPGWTSYLDVEWETDGAGGLKLFIVSDTENSITPGERIRVRHGFDVPPASYNRDNWIVWCFERFLDVLRHEGGEFFRVDGERVFAPHHGNGEDPYVSWFMSDHATASKRAGDD